MSAIVLLHGRERLGYSHGQLLPNWVGQLAVKNGASIPVRRVEALMRQVLDRIAPATALPERPQDVTGVCRWVLELCHQLQCAHRLTVLQAPQVISIQIEGEMIKVGFVAALHHVVLAKGCLQWVLDTVNMLAVEPNTDLKDELARVVPALNKLARDMKALQVKGVNTERMLGAALACGVPLKRIATNVYQIGQGVHGRWLQSSFTDTTSHLGAQFARNKLMASKVLSLHGLPVAEHLSVNSADEAVETAEALGYPVVVKAADLDGGVGVHAGLVSANQVRSCFDEARSHTRSVMVERHQPGADYRLTVVHDEVVKVIQRIPGGVVGDGKHTVRELLETAVGDEQYRRRMRERGKPLLKLDEEATELLQNKGLVAESVLAPGEFVALRRRANVSTGGTTMPVGILDVHADNARLALRAAQALRLDVAGVDLILPDIGQSWMQTGGIVCEVNGQPQFGENHSPGLYGRFFKKLMGGDGRIPVVVVVCAKPPTAAVVKRWQAVFAKGQGGDALVFDGLLYIAGECVNPAKRSNHRQAAAALANREVHKALFVLGQGEVLEHGFPVQLATNAVILNPQATANKNLKSTQSLTQALRPHVTGVLHVSNDLDGQSWQHLLDTPESAAT